jgi:hypothetical protein
MKNSTQQQEINRRRQIVSKLRHEGVKTQAEITQRLKDDYGFDVTQQTISNDLKALDKLWRSSAIDEIDKWKKELVSQYRYIYQQSLTAWELSLEDAEEVTQEKVQLISDAGLHSLEAKPVEKTKIKGQSGNPALLAQAQAALKAIREMFGVDKQVTGTDESPFIINVKYGERANSTPTQPAQETD